MVKAIVCDIEGTTTSLSFVKDTLFPYARRHISKYVRENTDNPIISTLLDDVRIAMHHPNATLNDIIDQLERWIDEDEKITPLKAIQGYLWEVGFNNGDYHGHVYSDAYEKLKIWHASGTDLYIFSSGSVRAQKLLFSHTEYGDLTPMFSGYFDTNIGAKSDPSSYMNIADNIGYPAMEILFLSDVKQELDAAKSAGLSTVWLIRYGSPSHDSQHPQVTNFLDITV